MDRETPCRVTADTNAYYASQQSEAEMNAYDRSRYELELAKILTNPDYIWEAIGPDAIKNNDECNRVAIELADLVMQDKATEVGVIICMFAKEYLEHCARIQAGLE